MRVALAAMLFSTLFFLTLMRRPAAISMPGLVLWAWERPEDLRFIDPVTTGVAYLAATVGLQRDGAARFHFRQQPLHVPDGTPLMAVVRIESPTRYVLPDSGETASILAGIARRRDLRGLQIDFDARVLERGFYRALLDGLRRKTKVPIGITALASWCGGDQWLDGRTLSEAVPMFFRMGLAESKEMSIQAAGCRDAIGLSTDEAWPAKRPNGLRDGARIYVFNPRAWTRPEYEAVVRRIGDWKSR